MTRASIAVLAIALLVPATAAAPASAKTKRVCKVVKRHGKVVRVHGHVKKRCRRVKVKPKAVTKIPIAATIQDGSSATLDFGGGLVRSVGLSGKLTGYIPGKIQLGTDIKAVLNGGSIAVAQTDFFSDGCASPVWARSDPATSITLDTTKANTAILHSSGLVESDANVIIRAVLDTRAENACDQPLATTGYSDSAAFVHLHGQVGAGGLTSLQLGADPYPLTLNACMTPGVATSPCAAAPIAYPTTATVSLKVLLDLSGKPTR
jgi:hypothetical protein